MNNKDLRIALNSVDINSSTDDILKVLPGCIGKNFDYNLKIEKSTRTYSAGYYDANAGTWACNFTEFSFRNLLIKIRNWLLENIDKI